MTTIANNDLIYIEAAHLSGVVLATTINNEVILETLVPNKPEQLWEQGDPDTDGYFKRSMYTIQFSFFRLTTMEIR